MSAGYGGEDYVGTALPLATFGIPYQMLVAYQGSSAAKAGLLRGDGDISSYGYSVFRPLIESHSVVPLFITARIAIRAASRAADRPAAGGSI